jgi:hypothetical protein
MRWRPVAAGGIPHTLIQGKHRFIVANTILTNVSDDVYGEYHFRKGTTFLANTWYVCSFTETNLNLNKSYLGPSIKTRPRMNRQNTSCLNDTSKMNLAGKKTVLSQTVCGRRTDSVQEDEFAPANI